MPRRRPIQGAPGDSFWGLQMGILGWFRSGDERGQSWYVVHGEAEFPSQDKSLPQGNLPCPSCPWVWYFLGNQGSGACQGLVHARVWRRNSKWPFQEFSALWADFWEGDEDSNFSVFRVRQFSEWPGPLHWIAFPVEIPTKPLIHWIASPLFT